MTDTHSKATWTRDRTAPVRTEMKVTAAASRTAQTRTRSEISMPGDTRLAVAGAALSVPLSRPARLHGLKVTGDVVQLPAVIQERAGTGIIRVHAARVGAAEGLAAAPLIAGRAHLHGELPAGAHFRAHRRIGAHAAACRARSSSSSRIPRSASPRIWW